MPVIVETINAPEEQDYQDLLKIYQDAPNWMLDGETPEGLLGKVLETQNYTLMAGRFNDRLLGAITLRTGYQGSRLEHLVVRKVTRRKGVATRLLEHVISIGDYPIKFRAVQNSTTDLLLDKLGFSKTDDVKDKRYLWVKES